MKILYVVTQADLGGAQRSTLLLAQHFQGELAAGIERDELFEACNQAGVKYHKVLNLRRGIKLVSDVLCLFELYRLFKKTKPDIVHLNSSKAGFIGSIAGKMAGVKVVYSARGFVFNEDRSGLVKRIFLFLERFASRFRDKIITVSEFDRNAALAARLIDPEKIVTINNAVNQVDFLTSADAKTELGLPADKKLVVTIANFYLNKGLDLLIEALSLLPDPAKNNLILVIFGNDGPEEKTLKAQVRANGLENSILFKSSPVAAKYLKAFNLFVLPSRKEGFPLTLLEAMQAGLPIIATNVGGNAEAIENAGVLVNPGDPKKLSEAINYLLSDPAACARFSQEALARSRLFTTESLFSKINSLYQSLDRSS